jgi:lipopolysaccharide biosynthesis regulator YciM
MEVVCKKCGYSWDYQGSAEYYACCPKCRTPLSLKPYREAAAKEAGK